MRGRRLTRAVLPFAVLMAAALAVRLVGLGDRPFHHDESQDAYFSWILAERGDYGYDPLLHGPVRFYLTAAIYLLLGDSDTTARLAPALMGTLIVGLPFLLRRQLGYVACLAAAVALAFGPSFLYFSRFAREDIYIAAINLGLMVAVFRFLHRPTPAGPSIILGLTAVAMATKETTYITLFVAGTFLIPAALIQHRRGVPGIWEALEVPGRVGWAYGAATYALVFTVLFTVFLTDPPGLKTGLVDSLTYWLGQHDVGRGGERPGFYVLLLVGDEWPALVLGAVGAVAVLRRPTLIGAFCIWAFLVSLAVYSWAGEKFAWLILHPLTPLLLLAGLGVQAIWRARRPVLRAAGGLLVAGCLGYMGFASVQANARLRADPRELLVSTQTSEAVKHVVAEVRRRDRPKITIDSADGATFPYAWYFRHEDVGYIDMTTTAGYRPDADVLVVTDRSQIVLGDRLRGYRGRRFPFRVWWIRDYSRALDAGAWWGYWTRREPWNPTGGNFEWLYRRSPPSTGGAGGSEAPPPAPNGSS